MLLHFRLSKGPHFVIMQQNTVGFELSAQQKFLLTVDPASSAATAQVSLTLAGVLDAAQLRLALGRIIERYEILRTRFRRSSGMRFPLQVISDLAPLPWRESDLQSFGIEAQATSIRESRKSAKITGNLQGHLFKLSETRHQLLLQIPALSADSRTLKILIEELSQLYGGREPWQADAIQYADYAEWQRSLIDSRDSEQLEAKEFWDSEGQTNLQDPSLPFGRKLENEHSYARAALCVPLDSSLIKVRSATDLPATLLAAWQVLLWRLTHASPFRMGITTSGRTQDDLQSAVGFFARTLPLRAACAPGQSFSEFAQIVRQRMEKVERHQDYFSGLPPPFPSIGFSVERPSRSFQEAGITFSIVDETSFTPAFDLELKCHLGETASLELFYIPSRFWEDGADRIARSLGVLLNSAFGDPTTQLKLLPVVDELESRQIFSGFNQTSAPFSDRKCIHHLFQEQAALAPTNPALRYGDLEITFGQLNERSNQIAHFLQQRGVGPNVPVCLCMERSAEMIVALLGILKAGGCYVPLIHDQPEERLRDQIEETEASVILTQDHLLHLFAGFAKNVVCTNQIFEIPGSEFLDNPQSDAVPSDLAYIIFTSGSTGRPKGVAVRHSSLVNYSQFICQRVGAYASILSFATVSTLAADLGNTGIFPALISGNCLHVIGYETALSADLFADYLKRHPIDILKITPSHLSTLLTSNKARSLWPRRFLFLGGEVLTWDLLTRIRAAASCIVINHYGPTEATVGCCTFEPATNDVSAWSPATVPIGRPVANARIHILDSEMKPAPIGIAGELYVGGTGLAQGYFHQREQTEEKFITEPFSGERVYKTGDFARFLPDGNIEFFGRVDHQIKLRGFRIEPAEIEAAIGKHPGVERVVVLPYEDMGEKRLAAYIISGEANVEWRSFVSQLLPEYMVPSQFVQLERLPLTPNGKADLHALSLAREAATAQARFAPVAPRTAEEEVLAAIWFEVLKKPCSDVHASFFSLGGHSLLAAQIISRVRDKFKVQFPLHSFLQSPTIAEMAGKISQCPRLESGDEVSRLLAKLADLSEEDAEKLLAEIEGR